MIINNIFTNKKEEILKAIETLPSHNCITNFVKYIDVKAEDKFEEMYVERLRRNIEDLAREVFKQKFSKLEKEELLKELIDANIEGPYTFICYYDNGEIEDFFNNNGYNDVDAHSLIKDYMLKEYNLLCDKLEMNLQEEKIDRINKVIEEKRRMLSLYEQDIIQLTNELKELNK